MSKCPLSNPFVVSRFPSPLPPPWEESKKLPPFHSTSPSKLPNEVSLLSSKLEDSASFRSPALWSIEILRGPKESSLITKENSFPSTDTFIFSSSTKDKGTLIRILTMSIPVFEVVLSSKQMKDPNEFTKDAKKSKLYATLGTPQIRNHITLSLSISLISMV